jgi:putative membrane protein
MNRQTDDILKGIAAGALAGLIGGLVMNQFQNLLSKLTEDKKESEHANSQKSQQQQKSKEEEEPATVKAAEAISCAAFDHELTKKERKVADPTVHYAFSMTSGMVYGALAEITPITTIGFGLPFSTVLWALADETMVPLFGLAKPPTQVPLSKHVSALVSHWVYGATTEASRQFVRCLL